MNWDRFNLVFWSVAVALCFVATVAFVVHDWVQTEDEKDRVQTRFEEACEIDPECP